MIENKPKMTIYYLIFANLFFIIFIFLYLLNIYDIATEDKKLPNKNAKKENIAVRGKIITADDFVVAESFQLYKATIDTRYLDKNKIELFIALFSIYSGIEKDEIRKLLNSQEKEGMLVLSHNINSKTAANLNELSQKLMKLEVFIPLTKKSSFIIGLDVGISGDTRVYKYNDTLTPILGKTSKDNSDDITRVVGIVGLEKQYNRELNDFQNGLSIGLRDSYGNIIINKDTKIIQRSDGKSIKLTIPIKLQRNIEFISDKYKQIFEASEILVSIMDSKTGKILSLASSNRFNPKKINNDEVAYLTINSMQRSYEYGSVIKPIIMALAIDKNKIGLNELFDAYNESSRDKDGYYKKGRYKIDRHYIHDDHNFKKRYITPYDTIVYSSNIGILQIAQKLKANEYIEGFESFNISKKTQIDLPYENKGIIHSLKEYSAYESEGRDNIFKATDSYGQGMLATFIQILSAYSTFNNDGKISKPYIVSDILDSNDNVIDTTSAKSVRIISQKTADIIKDMLIQTVKKGTGESADVEGFIIGGKTGTSQIARKGKYQKDYISSFFGFANDNKDSRYTIGVTVFNPSYKYHYASSSAAVVFKDVVKVLIAQGYLY